MTGFQEADQDATTWCNKLLIDIDDIKPGCMGKAVPIRNIVIFQDPSHPDQENTRKFGKKLAVNIERVDESLMQNIRELDGVDHVEIDLGGIFPWVIIQSEKPAAVLASIELICKRHNTFILNYIRKKETRPKFDATPYLEPISTSQAARILLRRFLGGNNSSLLLDEFNNNSLELFMELAELISTADCHRLFVGPLPEMADILYGLTETDGVDR